eukprot:m.91472 g.91472  ORF g.91472 m.91472 type:complete len:70 (+) comp16491_c1_seq2:308-517(+)
MVNHWNSKPSFYKPCSSSISQDYQRNIKCIPVPNPRVTIKHKFRRVLMVAHHAIRSNRRNSFPTRYINN